MGFCYHTDDVTCPNCERARRVRAEAQGVRDAAFVSALKNRAAAAAVSAAVDAEWMKGFEAATRNIIATLERGPPHFFKENSMLGTGRFDYVRYDEQAMKTQAVLKEKHAELEKLIEELPPGRGQALALTKLEECYMWVGKAIRDDQVKRNGSAPLQEQRGNE